MIMGLQIVQYWKDYFNSPSGGLLGLFNAIMGIGFICGIPFISDRFGRHLAICTGIFFTMVGIALQTASTSFSMFIVASFLMAP